MNAEQVEILDHEVVFRGFLRVERYRLKHRRFDGGWTPGLEREVLERGHVGAVLPVDPIRDQMVLIEQFRPGALAAGLGPWLLECVAGVIEPGEDAQALAVREAREEAGCEILELERIGTFLTSPGACSETVELFCGRVDSTGLGGVHGLADEGEDIRVHIHPVSAAGGLLAGGHVLNAKTVIALQWLQLHYPDLRSRWLGSGG